MSPQAAQTSVRETFMPHAQPLLTLVVNPARQYFYIHSAVPVKNARVEEDGQCQYLLECFPIAQNATPGQVNAMKLQEAEAVYLRYTGHISKKKGEDGLMPGYVYAASMSGTRLSDLVHVYHGRPRVHVDTSKPRYHKRHHDIQSYAEQIATEQAIHARRYKPRKVAARAQHYTCGG